MAEKHQKADQQRCSGGLDLSEGLSQFTLDLYRLFCDGDENVFMSPYSVAAALLLVNLGARGATEKEIRIALGQDEAEQLDLHWEYKQLQETLNKKTKGNTTLAVANRVYAKLGLSVLQDYIDKSKTFYQSEMQQLDFVQNPEESRQTINTWVEKQTNDKIKDLVPAGSIRPDSLMVLVNAIYFKGKWDNPFKPESTKKQDFHVSSDQTVQIDMMNAKLKLRYHRYETLATTAVEIPYESESAVMVVILPDQEVELSSLEERLNGESLRNICKELHISPKLEVILGLPKFKLETTYDMTKAMGNLGIKTMMDPRIADFGAMLKQPEGAYISDVIHKAFVEVNEEGTEAAAATAMMMRCMAMPIPPEEFIADRPFLFLIRDTETDTVLFLGRYKKPATQ